MANVLQFPGARKTKGAAEDQHKDFSALRGHEERAYSLLRQAGFTHEEIRDVAIMLTLDMTYLIDNPPAVPGTVPG